MSFFACVRPLYTARMALGATIVLSACASPPKVVAPENKPLPTTQITDSKHFGQETLYALAAAEIGLVRGRYELGLNNYVQQARDTQDVNIAARATQIARILQRHPESLEMAELWHQLDAGSHEARFILVDEYAHAERFKEAFAQADRLLSAGHSAGFDDIAIDAVQAKYSEIETLSARFDNRLLEYPDNVELLTGASVLQQYQQQYDKALTLAQRAEALAPDNVRAIYQHFRVLSAQQKEEEATKIYGRLVELQPDNRRVRTSYARMLTNFDLQQALSQYQQIRDQDQNDHDVLLNIALIQLELKQYDDAQQNLQALVDQQQHVAISQFGLGEIANEREQLDQALAHYRAVTEGPRYVLASSKAANIITQQSGLADAREFLSGRRTQASDDDRESLYLIESNALRASGQEEPAIELLGDAISSFPDSTRLRYARAMQFASMREPLRAEQDFKHILQISPENAATLNALGYTLLDQTARIDEAGEYIAKALALEPDDAAILDSMGWYHFKRGDTHKALPYLERAFELLKDDEIAAHLGEAYWSMGKKSKAKKVWRKGFEDDSESPFIRSTLERLNIEWP